MLDEPSVALFQKQWQLYRKIVDHNYLFHREAYRSLHRPTSDVKPHDEFLNRDHDEPL
jgi:hypothetical protein